MSGFAAVGGSRHLVWRLVLFALLVVLQVADVATTKVALAISGNYEMNPAVTWLVANLGTSGWILPKLALIGFGALALRRLPRWLLGGAVSVYCLIIANNLVAIFAMPGGAA